MLGYERERKRLSMMMILLYMRHDANVVFTELTQKAGASVSFKRRRKHKVGEDGNSDDDNPPRHVMDDRKERKLLAGACCFDNREAM